MQIDSVLPVPVDQALNALTDRRFLAECFPFGWTEADDSDELLRGVWTLSEGSEPTTYRLGVRLIDIDPECGALRFEVLGHEVEGQGLISLALDMNVNAQGSQARLVIVAKLSTAGLGDFESGQMELAVSSMLSTFGAGAAIRLAEGGGQSWNSPGIPAASNEEQAEPPTSATASPVWRNVILFLGAIAGTAVVGEVVWRAIHVVRSKNRGRQVHS